MKKFMRVLCFGLVMAVMVGVSSAGYTDASSSNTVLGNPTGWLLRDGLANNGTIYQSYSGAEMIMTTVTGLTPGQAYDVGVNYWNANGQFWCVSAGLSPNAMLFFADQATSPATNLSTSTLTGVTEVDRYELLGSIGVAIADLNGNITVYIDDEKPTNHTSYNNRAWYDGITVTAVPEPATLVLLGLGGLMFRKRK